MGKLTKKEVAEIVGVNTANLPEEQKQFIDMLVGSFAEAINKSIEGVIDTDGLKKALEPFVSKNGVTIDSLAKENTELVQQVKNLSEALDKMKKKGFGLDFATKFNERFDEMYDSPQFQDFPYSSYF